MKGSFYKKAQRAHTAYSVEAIALLFASLILSGCGNSDISAVKSAYIDESMTTTISQLLDNRKICADVKWDSFEDQNKRKVVEYKCVFINSKKSITQKKESYINNQTIALDEKIKQSKKQIAEYENKIADQKNNGDSIVKSKTEKINYAPEEKSEGLKKLMQASDKINQLKSNYNEDDFINLLVSDDFRMIIGKLTSDINATAEQNRMLRNIQADLGPLAAQVYWMRQEKTVVEQQKYKRDSVDGYLKNMRSYIENLGVYFNERIVRQDQEAAERRTNQLADMEQKKAEIRESIDGNIRGYEQMISVLNESISTDEAELQTLEDKSNKLYPQYKSIVETFQWIVNNENRAVPMYGELTALSANEEKKTLLNVLVATQSDTSS